MAEMLFFVRVDTLDPATTDPVGHPRCLAIRTTSDLQADVLQQRLVDAIHAEHKAWIRHGAPPKARPLWRRWLANVRALFPGRATAHKLPADVIQLRRHITVQRRRAF